MPSESKTSKRRLAAAERQVQALELRKGGATFPAIAHQLGYSSSAGAYKAVLTALRETKQEPADEVRRLAIERLDRILLAIWKRALDGDLECIDRVLKIEARRAKLLGLDVFDKVDIEWRIRMMARALGFNESEEAAAVAEAQAIIRQGQGTHATTL